MAATAIEILLRPEVVSQAKMELQERLNGASYVCPIPQGVRSVKSL